MRLIILGPPGAGKGTQAELLSEALGVPHISTGDLFRANISQGTAIGVEAKRYLDAGDLVPSEVTVDMVRARIAEPDAAHQAPTSVAVLPARTRTAIGARVAVTQAPTRTARSGEIRVAPPAMFFDHPSTTSRQPPRYIR